MFELSDPKFIDAFIRDQERRTEGRKKVEEVRERYAREFEKFGKNYKVALVLKNHH